MLDPQADIDDSALDTLGHRHSANGVFVRQVIADHGMEELLWWHVIRGLLYPVLAVWSHTVSPLGTGDPPVSHHEEWQHLGHDLSE